MGLLFKTPHGSRLYGIHHADSDYDTFQVYGWQKGRARQSIQGNQDVTRVSFDKFMTYCEKGVPQYLEAMFSRQATVNLIPYITDTYRPNMVNVRDVYKRTIKSFWMDGMENNDAKKRRHAVRLKFNLQSIQVRGRFNPTMNELEKTVANMATFNPDGFEEWVLDN